MTSAYGVIRGVLDQRLDMVLRVAPSRQALVVTELRLAHPDLGLWIDVTVHEHRDEVPVSRMWARYVGLSTTAATSSGSLGGPMDIDTDAAAMCALSILPGSIPA